MIRIVSGLLVLAFLAACGADGAPLTPTKSLKERLADRAAAQVAKDTADAELVDALEK